ncbi:MAG: hypothetical protein ACE5G8_15925, partial [Anaerolineae bacterium]
LGHRPDDGVEPRTVAAPATQATRSTSLPPPVTFTPISPATVAGEEAAAKPASPAEPELAPPTPPAAAKEKPSPAPTVQTTPTSRPPALSLGGATPRPPTPAPQLPPTDADAAQAISRYAADVLGISVEVVTAGSKSGEVTLPPSAEASVEAAVTLAGATYAGVLQGGAASVSLGEGEISGDLNADIQDASLGAFALLRPGPLPAAEAEALNIVRAAFPALSDWPFVLQEIAGEGGSSQPAGLGGGPGKLTLPTPQGGGLQSSEGAIYIFLAQTEQTELDVRSGQAKVVTAAALAGVSPGGAGRVNVFAVVGKGSLAGEVAR